MELVLGKRMIRFVSDYLAVLKSLVEDGCPGS